MGVLDSDPEYLGGSVRFVGTRVPVQALLDTLESGGSVIDFVEGWPDVSISEAEKVVRWRDRLMRETFGLSSVA